MDLILKRLDEAFSVKDGTHDSPKYVNKGDGFPLITSKNLKSGVLDFENVDYISKEDFDKINRRSKVDKGDLLFAMIGTIGNPVIVDMEPNFAIKNVALIKPNEERNSVEYLRFYLKNNSTKQELFRQTKGGTQQFVSLGVLRQFPIPLPPLPAQIRIATILNRTETLIAKRKQSIQLLDRFLKDTFLKIFGDPELNTKGFETKTLNQISKIKGQYGAGASAIAYNPNRPRYIRITDINENGELNDEKVSPSTDEIDDVPYILDEGDILFARSGATVGKTYLHKKESGPAIFAGYLVRFKLTETIALPIYIYHFTKTSYYSKWIKSTQTVSAQPNINANLYGNQLEIPIPNIELQNEFSHIVEKTERLKKYYTKSLLEFENLSGSLSQKAFTGKLDLSKLDIVIEDKFLQGRLDAITGKYSSPKILKQKPERKSKRKIEEKAKSKITWDKVSSQQVAEWIKENYKGFYFSSEMLILFLKGKYVVFPDYYSSEELKKYPQLNGADDIKSFIFSAISNENPFIKLEQHFYNAEKETFSLKVTDEDYQLIESRDAKERSGIYFSIIEQ